MKKIFSEHLIQKEYVVRHGLSSMFLKHCDMYFFFLRCGNRRFDVNCSWFRGWTTGYFTNGRRKFRFLCLVKAQGSLVGVERAFIFTMVEDYHSIASSFLPI